jgi:F0F1-type ATP synthase epsilon subunit
MQNDELTLLTDEATAADQIDLAEAEDALRQANEQAITGIDERDAKEHQQQRAMAQVTLARSAGT